MKASPLKLVVSGAIGVSDWCSSLADRYTPPDVEFVRGVLDFVIAKHGDDRTRQGTLLRDHICAVAGILSELKLDRDAIAAGLLFRVAEAPDDVRAIRGQKYQRRLDKYREVLSCQHLFEPVVALG